MTIPTASPARGFHQRETHHLNVQATGERVQVTYRGEVIADSRDVVRLDEAKYPAVYYFPRKDVKMDRLARSPKETFCPYKGHASYFSLKNGPDNAVWTYENPFGDVSVIRERVAFYPDKVDSIISG